MSNVIGLLETMGQDATLRHMDQGIIAIAMSCAQIEPELQAAILDKDANRIERLSGAARNVCCMVFPVKEDEDEDGETPNHDDDEISMTLPMTHHVVTAA